MVLLLPPVSAPPSVGAPSRPLAASTDASEASTPGSAASPRGPASEASPASVASLALLEHPRPTLADMETSVQPIARSILKVVMVGSSPSCHGTVGSGHRPRPRRATGAKSGPRVRATVMLEGLHGGPANRAPPAGASVSARDAPAWAAWSARCRRREKNRAERCGNGGWLGGKARFRRGKARWRGGDRVWRRGKARWRGGDRVWRRGTARGRGGDRVWRRGKARWRGADRAWRRDKARWRGGNRALRGDKARWRDENGAWRCENDAGRHPSGAGEGAGSTGDVDGTTGDLGERRVDMDGSTGEGDGAARVRPRTRASGDLGRQPASAKSTAAPTCKRVVSNVGTEQSPSRSSSGISVQPRITPFAPRATRRSTIATYRARVVSLKTPLVSSAKIEPWIQARSSGSGTIV